jgi:hypothetical protein
MSMLEEIPRNFQLTKYNVSIFNGPTHTLPIHCYYKKKESNKKAKKITFDYNANIQNCNKRLWWSVLLSGRCFVKDDGKMVYYFYFVYFFFSHF